MENNVKYLESFTKELFELLGFGVDVITEVQDDTYHISIEGDDLAAVIGRHGNTLNSIEHVVSLAATQHFGDYTHVFIDAGGWRKNRQEQLEQMAERAVERVRTTGKAYEFPPMSAQERRIVHMAITQEDDLVTESEGEGANRHIVVHKK